MALTIACRCGQHYSVDEQYAGQRVPCSGCGQIIQIPAAPARGPRQSFAAEEPPASRGGGAVAALVATLLFVVVLGGGLAGVVWWLKQLPGEQVAVVDDKSQPPQKKDETPAPPAPAPREEKDKRDVAEEPPPPQAQPNNQPKTLPPPSDRPWQGHLSSVLAVSIDRAGKHVWTASGGVDEKQRPAPDSTLRRWDAVSGKETDRIELLDAGIAAAAFDADGKRAAVAVPGKTAIELWDLAAKKKIATLDEHIKPVRCLAFSGDGRRLVSGGDDKLLIVWDLSTNKALHKLNGHTNGVNVVAVSADGRAAVTGGLDHTARLWDLDKGEQKSELSGHGDIVWAAALSHDGKLALTGGGLQQLSPTVFVAGARDHEVRCWDASTAKEKKRGQPLASAVTALAFSPDARRYLAGGNDGSLRLWQLDTNKEARRLEGHGARVRAVAFFAGGRRAVSVGDDKTIRVWDLPADLPELARDVKSDDATRRLDALAELVRLGGDARPAVPSLFEALAVGDSAWKERVLGVLKTFSPLEKEHVGRLERVLQQKQFTQGRLYAAEELARLGEDARPAAKSLLAAVADDDVAVRRKSLEALAPVIDSVAATAFKPLVGALRDRDAMVRQQAEKALQKLGAPGAEHLGLLQKLLKEDAVAMKRFSLRALGEMGDTASPAVGDVVERAKSDKSAEVRQQALESLAKIAPNDTKTIEAATKALADSNADVCRQAAKALATARDVPGLVAALEHDDEEVGKTADEALKKARLTKSHLTLLTGLVQSKRPVARRRAVEALAALGDDAAGAVPALGKALKSANEEEQKQILSIFVSLGASAKAAGPEVAKLLKTKDKGRQFAICKVLIKIEAPEVKQAVGGLIEQLRPGNAEDVEDEEAVAVRDKARALLVQIGKPAVAPILEALEGEYAGSKGDAGTLNGHARLAMVKALAEMGPAAGGTQTLAVLARLRKSEPFPLVREEAKRAYVRVQKKE